MFVFPFCIQEKSHLKEQKSNRGQRLMRAEKNVAKSGEHWLGSKRTGVYYLWGMIPNYLSLQFFIPLLSLVSSSHPTASDMEHIPFTIIFWCKYKHRAKIKIPLALFCKIIQFSYPYSFSFKNFPGTSITPSEMIS